MAITEIDELVTAECERKAGRPRCAKAHVKILEAGLEEVGTHGYEAMTMEAIAHRAGVSKATIYRRWGSKAELMLDAMQVASCGMLGFVRTGTLRGDLENQMRALVQFLNGERSSAIRAVIAAVQSDCELAGRFREVWTEKRRAAFDGIFAEAVERGEIAGDADFELLIDLVWGPIYYRFVSNFEVIEGCMVGRVLDKVLPVFVK
ncbi:hypothetical protein CCB80_13310 [Armatimonadetes bacterium Uphvl-Ar1]|nr:hypothetical protein CCB80_13310 [Armatimonadetes bacterium Uphvl-Ar1]